MSGVSGYRSDALAPAADGTTGLGVIRADELSQSLTETVRGKWGPHWATALEVWVQASQGQDSRRAGELTLTPADGSTAWSSLSTAGELSLLVQIRKSWWADQLSYRPSPDPDPGL